MFILPKFQYFRTRLQKTFKEKSGNWSESNRNMTDASKNWDSANRAKDQKTSFHKQTTERSLAANNTLQETITGLQNEEGSLKKQKDTEAIRCMLNKIREKYAGGNVSVSDICSGADGDGVCSADGGSVPLPADMASQGGAPVSVDDVQVDPEQQKKRDERVKAREVEGNFDEQNDQIHVKSFGFHQKSSKFASSSPKILILP